MLQMGLALAKDVKTVAFGLEPVEGLTLTGQFQMTNARAAGDLKTLLEAVKIDGAKSQKVEAPPAKEPEQWLTWQVRGDVAAMRAWLSKDAKK